MGSFGDFGKREKKKKKQAAGAGGGVGGFSSRPIFVPPPQIKKEKREK